MSMLLPTILILVSSHGFCSPVTKYKSCVGLNSAQIIEHHGYLCENHDITTEDGYILTYQRIPHGKTNSGSHKIPIIIMHGLLASSEFLVSMDPEHTISYTLADLGYDVWLANARGTAWSRRHKTLDVVLDNERFFDFSWHEIGYYDLPAAVDYILNVTKHESLHYIGHSQGGTAFLVLASTRPEYNKKIKLASLLAPSAFMEHFSINVLKALCEYIYELEILLQSLRIYELPFVNEIRNFSPVFCAAPAGRVLCKMLISLIFNQITEETENYTPELTFNAPANCAMKQILHYGQLIRNGGYSQYDHGIVKNLQIYGQQNPPSYDLSRISSPVAVFSSLGDVVVNHLDMKKTIQSLPNVVYEYQGSYKLGHAEMIFAREITDPVEGKLIKALHKYK